MFTLKFLVLAALIGLNAVVAFSPPYPAGEAFSYTVSGLGTLTGINSPLYNTKRFLGIPFGIDTALTQFLPSVPVPTPWDFSLDATEPGPGCYGRHNNDSPVNQSTDCLNMDLWLPGDAAPGTNYSVSVFVHGGSWLEGCPDCDFGLYSGATLAQNGVIRVNINYRLSVLGLLALEPSLITNPAVNITGNQMVYDVMNALQWVKDWIYYFGGDPNRVTIQGESAGAMTIGMMMASPFIQSKNLFQQAIMESNVAGFDYKNLTEASLFGMSFCEAVGCNTTSQQCDATCLQQLNPLVAMSAWSNVENNAADFIVDYVLDAHLLDAFLGTTVTIDGVIFPYELQYAAENGLIASMPTLIGTNQNEADTFIYDIIDFAMPPWLYSGLAELAYSVIFSFNGTVGKEIYDQPRYNPNNYTDVREALSNTITDYWFSCASERIVDAQVLANNSDVYVYRYAHLLNDSSVLVKFGLPAVCANVVCHAAELVGVTALESPLFQFTSTEDVLFAQMIAFWTNFIKTGNPNTGSPTNAIQWPSWDPQNRYRMVLNDTNYVDNTQEICGFWDSLGYMY